MDNLETLRALLDITVEAEALASEIGKPIRLRDLLMKLRSKAKEERTQLKHFGRPATTRYELCLTGILEELNFGKLPCEDILGLDSRLTRIREEIERTMREIKANRKIM
jgi:hypothetical protein